MRCRRINEGEGMPEIGIGLIGGGYMGKAHAVALSAVGAVFDTPLRPRLEMVAASSAASAERYARAYGFRRGTGDWRELVADPHVDAVVIASPQKTHLAIAKAAFALSKPGLYYHFENKQEILFSIINEFMDKNIQALKKDLKKCETPYERLFCIIDNHIQAFVKYPAQTKVVIYEIHSLNAEYSKKLKPKRIVKVIMMTLLIVSRRLTLRMLKKRKYDYFFLKN